MKTIPARYHRTDGWRGYSIPGRAVAGASDTGMADDSPAPTDAVMVEIAQLRHALRNAGIKTRVRSGTSSNVFMAKRWLMVENAEDHARAMEFANAWLAEHHADTRYIHDAT